MNQPTVFRFKKWDVVIVLRKYLDANQRQAIQLEAADTEHNRAQEVYPGEIITTASVNVPEQPLTHNQTIIKTWGENKGILEWLAEKQLVFPTGKTVPCGHAKGEIVILLPKLYDSAEVIE